MNLKIAVLPGDGIGPEVVAEGVKVLQSMAKKFSHNLELHYGDIGGCAIDHYGVPLPEETLEMCRGCQAVLLGAVGGPKWESLETRFRPEAGLLSIRKDLDLFANLRPVKDYKLPSPLRSEVVRGVDILFVRELIGGIYFSRPKGRIKAKKGRQAVDTLRYTEYEIKRVLRVAFELAKKRRKKLTSVDKANVLESSRLWREIAEEIHQEYPEVELRHYLVDSCAMRLIQKPTEFDVIVIENFMGDILTDEAGVLAGSLGMLPSASLAEVPVRPVFGLYEPVHGSAPDIAGKGIANPIATILSCALMLRYSFGLEKEAEAIESAVIESLNDYRTVDIMELRKHQVSTQEMGEIIAQRI